MTPRSSPVAIDTPEFAHVLRQPGLPASRVRASLDLALPFMRRSSADQLVDEYLSGAAPGVLSGVKRRILRVDHVGLLSPAGLQVADLEALASASGFSHEHRSFPSVVVASELTALNAGVAVPTRILRAATGSGDQGQEAYGLEVFVPETTDAVVEQWIAEGVGTHVAFRLRDHADVDHIRVALQSASYRTPAFMHGAPMTNTNDGTYTIYFDLPVAVGHFRLEFFHR